MGLTDEKNEGKFELRSGAQTSFDPSEHWQGPNPNGNRDENCVIMYPRSGLQDFPCNKSFQYQSVCQNTQWSGKDICTLRRKILTMSKVVCWDILFAANNQDNIDQTEDFTSTTNKIICREKQGTDVGMIILHVMVTLLLLSNTILIAYLVVKSKGPQEVK